MSKPDEGVSEMAGVWAAHGATGEWIEVRDAKAGVSITVCGRSGVMTPMAARTLARQLYRQARRWEARNHD